MLTAVVPFTAIRAPRNFNAPESGWCPSSRKVVTSGTAISTAELLCLTDRTLRRWASTGRIKVLKTARGGSGRVLVPKAELERILRLMWIATPFED
jgi:hypothetical protein